MPNWGQWYYNITEDELQDVNQQITFLNDKAQKLKDDVNKDSNEEWIKLNSEKVKRIYRLVKCLKFYYGV